MAMELVRQLLYNHPYRWDGTLFGGPKLWRPDSLSSNLAMWLDAEDASTITLNGSTVSQWSDKSGNGRHATQATAANQPTYASSAINSKPALSLDGVNDFMNLPLSSSVINNQASVFMVVRITTAQSNYNATLAWSIGVGSVSVGIGPFGAANTYGLYGTFGAGATNLFDIGPTAINTNYLSSLSWTNNGLSVNGGFNGANISGTRTNSFTGIVNGLLGLDATSYSSATVGEIVITPMALDIQNRQKVEGYLAWKWGLEANLPSGHPYKLLPPTV